MFIKSALALILTVGFAGGAVYYGTNAGNGVGGEASTATVNRNPQTNEVNVSVPEKPVTTPSSATAQKQAAQKQAAKKQAAQKQAAQKQAAKKQAAKKKAVKTPNTQTKTAQKKKAKPIGAPKSAEALDLKRIMPMLMVQAGRIKNTEIKDQAYLDIVSFSVNQRQFTFADAALEKIDQAELRDTARSQIAIALALDGKADEAFAVIDTVEIDALRDVMRLQVIEALILPQKLPSGLR